MEVANLFVKISADTTKAINELDKFESKFKTAGINIAKVGIGMTATLTAPLVAIGTKAFDMAANFNDALGATDQIFKDSSKEMQDWASNLETYYGVAETEALVYANTMGAMLQNIGGLSESEAAKQSQTLVGLAGDLSAMFGGTTESAVQALTGALKGNNTMLDNYGMAVTEGMIKTKALEMGLIKEGEEMTLTAKQGATLALIMEQAGDATGQAEREADGASGTVKTLQTEMANLTKTLGEELLPVIVPIIQNIVDLVKKFSNLDDGTKKLIIQIGVFLAVAGPITTILGGIIGVAGVLFGVLGSLSAGFMGTALASNASTVSIIAYNVGQFLATTASGALTVATWLLNGALAVLTSPITLVILAIVALIAIGVALWKNWDKIKEVASNVWKWVTEKFQAIVDFIGNIDWAKVGMDVMNGIWNGLKGAWDGIWNWISGVGQAISDALTGQKNAMNTAQAGSLSSGGYDTNRIFLNTDYVENANGSGFSQTLIFNSPRELSASEIARQTQKASRGLALGLT